MVVIARDGNGEDEAAGSTNCLIWPILGLGVKTSANKTRVRG